MLSGLGFATRTDADARAAFNDLPELPLQDAGSAACHSAGLPGDLRVAHHATHFHSARLLTQAERAQLATFVADHLAPLAGPAPGEPWLNLARTLVDAFDRRGITAAQLQAVQPWMEQHDRWVGAARQALDATRTGVSLLAAYLLRRLAHVGAPSRGAEGAEDQTSADVSSATAEPRAESAPASEEGSWSHTLFGGAAQGAISGALYSALGPVFVPKDADWEYGQLPAAVPLPGFVMEALLRQCPGWRQTLGVPVGQVAALSLKNLIRGALCSALAGRIDEEQTEQLMVFCDLFVAALTQPAATPVAHAVSGNRPSAMLAMLLRGEPGVEELAGMARLMSQSGWAGTANRTAAGVRQAVCGAHNLLANLAWQVTPEVLSSWVTGRPTVEQGRLRYLPPLISQTSPKAALLRTAGFTAVLTGEAALMFAVRQALQSMPAIGREAVAQLLVSVGMVPAYLAGSLGEQWLEPRVHVPAAPAPVRDGLQAPV